MRAWKSRLQRGREDRKRKLAAVSAGVACAVLFLTGCHGSKGLSAFAVPESFDETRNYEITFWAKNDTNKTQTAIYQNPMRCILFFKFVPSGCKYFLLML